MRTVLIAVCCALPLLAAEDPKEMVRRALDLYARDDAATLQYGYQQRDDVRLLDGSGKLKRRELRTYDIAILQGSPYRRLVRRNDQPLAPEEEKQQQAEFEHNAGLRRTETPEQRSQRIAEWERKRQQRQREFKEIPDAFDFRLAGEDVIDGVPAWIVEGTPHPGYRPRSKSAAYFVKMKGRMWIAKSDDHAVKIDAVTLDTISIGAFLIRIAQGGRIGLEFTRAGDDLWLPKHASLTGSARVLFVKGYHLNADYTFSGYRKSPLESSAAAQR